MKNFSALLLIVLLAAASRGEAQDALPDAIGDLPPGLGMPGDERNDMPIGEGTEAEGDSALVPEAEVIGEGIASEDFEGSILGEPMRALAACPSYFESSGTWLRRGFWYGEVDFLLFNRGWDKKGMILGREETLAITNPFGNGQQATAVTPGVGGPYVVGDYLEIRGHGPGMEGVGRVKLGRFLFRDAHNRDHSMQGEWTGGGDFQQSVSLTSPNANNATGNALQVSNFIDRVNPSFDGSGSMSYDYHSEMNSGELNYLVRSRLHRDRMLLEPSGQWVRAATPTRTYTYLAGMRFLNLNEILDWTANDRPGTPAVNEGGRYLVDTQNNMLGTQLGGSLGYETARWSIIGGGKFGAFFNRIDLRSQFDLNRTTNLDGFTNSTEDDLSFVGEAQLTAKWHLRPNVSLRTGLEVLFIDSIALAPQQLNFVPGGYEQIAITGDSVYLGTSLGLEAYW